VTLVTCDGTRRLVSNRDEEHTRPAAEAPQAHHDRAPAMVFPRDPVGGGTWIGANDRGLIATLLNGNPPFDHRPPQPRSRGELVRSLLSCSDLDDCERALASVDWARYPACRLVVSAAEGARSWWWDSRELASEQHPADAWLFFTSSGLGDELVAVPRRALWDEWFTPGEHPFVRQDLFHRHRWPERGELSVNMQRADARTVSCTTVSVEDSAVTMAYHAGAPDGPGADTRVVLERRAA